MSQFCHLHCHTQYSLLDGASRIEDMMKKAAADGQKGVALTDHGNMYGAFKFVNEAKKAGVKPILGCEFYLVDDRRKQSFAKSKGQRDNRYHQLLLAKNRKGYENLTKLCSLGFIEGMYGKFPRIDKELILQYHEGIIATSCCIGAEIPQTILRGEIEKAEKMVKWWVDIFGEDYYIELQRHKGLDNVTIRNEHNQVVPSGKSQEDVNQVLLSFAKKYNIKTICTNDSHYVEEEDASPHDILLCVNTGSLKNDPKGDARGERFAFPSSDFYFKSQEEMGQLFQDVPEALDHTMEIWDKVDTLDLARDVVLPKYPLPGNFHSEMEYLRHLTYSGAEKRYGEIAEKTRERLEFELQVIEDSGYPGYFLIVQDFTTSAREMGVWVGPGRGSAAGSAVAYCLGITNVDPIKYDLLFERFLNPERISMPDIDIDFDDVGRQKVIDYVVDKYGFNQVAQIVTYGTMAAKSSIRDVGRVLDLPLDQVNSIAKSIPTNFSLQELLAGDKMGGDLKEKLRNDDFEKVENLREMARRNDIVGDTIQMAQRLEGAVRNTGLHACAVVITPDEVSNYVPVARSKDSDLLVSQFDNSVAEDAGLLKMDFLGLRTLSIIKDAIRLVEENHDVKIDPDQIPLDDEKTYELFQRGDTIGIFQYESEGMQNVLRGLKPTRFEDLIAVNALYRPGPMEYIPDFIARKHGDQEISYDLQDMEEYLRETYGITVYQEQVMLLSQKLAGFSRGQADMLRKGMGKKKKEIIDELYPKFIEGGKENGHAKDKLEKIWKDWEAFASYAFNKSHSTCYAFVAFQTAYLKSNYPHEFLASALTHNKNDISKVNLFLRECKRMGIEVQPPNINLSGMDFSVTKDQNIVIGLSALKGVGEGPVEVILKERKENGSFSDLPDMMRRIDLSGVNKRVMESLAKAGAFDSLGVKRAQLFAPSDSYDTYLEALGKYGQSYQSQKKQLVNSLFGDISEDLVHEPTLPAEVKWPLIKMLEMEKEVVGIYASGHPLDDYAFEYNAFVKCPLQELNEQEKEGRKLALGGIVTEVFHGISKRGEGYGRFTLQDFTGSHNFVLFGEEYMRNKELLQQGQVLYVQGAFRKRYRTGDLQFNIQEVRQLSSVGKDRIKSLTLEFTLDDLIEETMSAIDDVIETHPGEHELKFKVHHGDETLKLKSRDAHIAVDGVLLDKIRAKGWKFSVQ